MKIFCHVCWWWFTFFVTTTTTSVYGFLKVPSPSQHAKTSTTTSSISKTDPTKDIQSLKEGLTSPFGTKTTTTPTTLRNAFLRFKPKSKKSALILQSSSTTEPSIEESTNTDTTTTKTRVLAHDHEFTKPERDLRQYRVIVLPNNLKVLLVSTAVENSGSTSSSIEAAAVHVKAGHFDDIVPGLAHFHEHMLFLGTTKYSNEDEYEEFLAKFGGYSNAYTDMEDTNYYFSVTTPNNNSNGDGTASDQTSEGLRGGLDRLAQFFIAPLFQTDMVEREMRAIDSEFRNGKTSDQWRNYQLLKHIANPQHPFSKFGCGNYATLTKQQSQPGTNNGESNNDNPIASTPAGAAPIKELKWFWDTFYTTSNLRLSVVGSSSLDALQATVEETFGQLPVCTKEPRHVNKLNTQNFFPKEHANYDGAVAFGPEQMGKIREIIPVQESRAIKIYFATPPLDDPVLRKARPHQALSHLMGHESPGSLHTLLNDLGLINGLVTGSGIDASDFSLFSVSISLTPKGMQQYELVLKLMFQWLALIKRTALQQPDLMAKYHNELRQMSMNNFRFRENSDPTDFCSACAEMLFDEYLEPQNLLCDGITNSQDYDPVVAKAFLDRIHPENSMISITNSDLKSKYEQDPTTWNVEPYYGAFYRETPMTMEQTREWEFPIEIDSRLSIPALNKYIPDDFTLKCDTKGNKKELTFDEARKQYPTLVQGPNVPKNLKLWYKMDQYWRVPKTMIQLALTSPSAYRTPRSMTLSRIYQRVLNDDLSSYIYDAHLAGCNYRISCSPTGYRVSVKGYSQKLPSLLDTVTTRMHTLIQEMKEGKEKHPALFDKFEKARESLLRETRNYRLDSPYENARYNSRLLMEENVWYLDDYLTELEGAQAEKHPLTMEECADVAQDCMTGRLNANALCMGNIDEEETQQVVDVINRHFLDKSSPLFEAEVPKFRSLKLPTRDEAVQIFGPEVAKNSCPVIYQELAYTSTEENNAVELTIQVGCDVDLGYEGITIVDLISHMAYNSAYNQLRTKEQLGYIVSVYTRKTAGSAWAISIVVQSSNTKPEALEKRIEAWLKLFRQEIQEMTPERMAMEASGLLGSLLERNTKLAHEVGSVWGEILETESYNERMSTPAFDRLDRLADELVLASSSETNENINDGNEVQYTMNGNVRKTPSEMKSKVLSFFDEFLALESPKRRAMSIRYYSQAAKDEFDQTFKNPGVLTNYSEMRYLKHFLSSWPDAPYWRVPPTDGPFSR